MYEIARGNRPEMYNLRYRKPEPLVKRRDIFELKERVLFDGTVAIPLDAGAVRDLAGKIKAGGYDAVAVVLLHAYQNPVHENLLRDVMNEELPGISVSLSHEVAREWREFERTSTTVLNAYTAPVVEKYLTRLEGEVRSGGMEEPLGHYSNLLRRSLAGRPFHRLRYCTGCSRRRGSFGSAGKDDGGGRPGCPQGDRGSRVRAVFYSPDRPWVGIGDS